MEWDTRLAQTINPTRPRNPRELCSLQKQPHKQARSIAWTLMALNMISSEKKWKLTAGYLPTKHYDTPTYCHCYYKKDHREITVSERYWSKILWADKRTTSNSALVEGSSSCKWKRNLLSWSFSSHSFLASQRNEWNCSYITLWDVNEPTHYSKRVEDEVPGDVVYLRHLHHHSSWVERAQWAHKRTDSGCQRLP